MANGTAKGKKGSAYFSSVAMEELRNESLRLDRSVSWLLQRAWRLARDEIRASPTRASGSSPIDPETS